MPELKNKKGKVVKRYPYTPAGIKAYNKAKDKQDGTDRYASVIPKQSATKAKRY